MKSRLRIPALLALLALAGCVSMPSGPSAMALPGSGMSWDRFRVDDAECRQFGTAQVGGATPDQAAATSGVNSAAVGALIGAAAGAAINGGQGAAVGAGAGLATGALVGTGAASTSSYVLQQRYDNAYLQCMYAKGHKVPVYGNFTSQQSARSTSGSYSTPPPPPPPR
ncbi:MAG TPA: hypothetical protein VF104_00850 [Burkholderiales bacterium]